MKYKPHNYQALQRSSFWNTRSLPYLDIGLGKAVITLTAQRELVWTGSMSMHSGHRPQARSRGYLTRKYQVGYLQGLTYS